jgi:hypothetical protein
VGCLKEGEDCLDGKTERERVKCTIFVRADVYNLLYEIPLDNGWIWKICRT